MTKKQKAVYFRLQKCYNHYDLQQCRKTNPKLLKKNKGEYKYEGKDFF